MHRCLNANLTYLHTGHSYLTLCHFYMLSVQWYYRHLALWMTYLLSLKLKETCLINSVFVMSRSAGSVSLNLFDLPRGRNVEPFALRLRRKHLGQRTKILPYDTMLFTGSGFPIMCSCLTFGFLAVFAGSPTLTVQLQCSQAQSLQVAEAGSSGEVKKQQWEHVKQVYQRSPPYSNI